MSGMAEQSLHRRVRELEATVTAMQNAFMAQEKAAMGMADVASDVRAMRKEQDSHRYDLRLLKASVGAHLVRSSLRAGAGASKATPGEQRVRCG